CHCPAAGDAVPPAAPDGDATPAPSFAVQLAASPVPGLVQLVATGCLGACTEPAARVQTTLGFVPAIATLPAAPLTVRDDVVTDAALALRNADAAGAGIALQAGGALLAAHARLGAPPGAPGPTVADHDAALHALAPDRLFATLFGLDKAVWQQQPGVARIRCERPCNDSVRRAAATHRLLWIDGDLPLDGPLAVGSPERPVLIVADGAVQFAGPVSVHGLVYASGAGWDDAAASSGALLRGALVSDSGWRGNAAPDLVYDAGILRALRADTGSFARLPGTWRDF
ncbi:MAG: hypothetical protein ACJ8G7_08125, partial [Rhizobacter sp.]